MSSRRHFLAGIGSVGTISVSGCLSENSDVVDHYTRGYELYHAAEDADDEEDYSVSADLYERAAGHFEKAEKNANDDDAQKYSEDSYRLAKVEAGEALNEYEDHREEVSDDRYETIDNEDFVEYTEKQNLLLEGITSPESPSVVSRETRLPF